LKRAIALYEEALADKIPLGSRASLCTNLSGAFVKRFLRFGDRENDTTDLSRAIDAARNAIQASRSVYDRELARMALANGLQAKGRKENDLKVLDETIKTYESIVESTSIKYLDRGAAYNNLGAALRDRYKLNNSIKDLEHMVTTYKKALSKTAERHPARCLYMSNLGWALAELSVQKESSRTKRKAMNLLSKSVSDSTLPVSTRIQLLVRTANVFINEDDRRVTECLTLATKLLPILSSRAVAAMDRQFKLSEYPGLASSAAAWLLESNKPVLEAIEVLEIGRGVILSGYLETRSDLTLLKESHPVLGHDLEQLQLQLDHHTSSSDASSIFNGSTRANHFSASGQSRLLDRHEEILREIRALPGFNRFLMGPSKDELISLAKDGPIVILNTHPNRCDAIVINKTRMYLLPLPALGFKLLEEKSMLIRDLPNQGQTKKSTETLVEILQWLWDCIAKLVLTDLGFNSTPVEGAPWPKVWWIPTGLLTHFPIHAAGYHAINSQETVMDRVISCYTTTIKALDSARKRKGRAHKESQPSLLLVAMPETPAQPDLPHAVEEVATIAAMIENFASTDILHQPTRSQVLEALRSHSMVHFACHGKFGNDDNDPSKSMLLLTDWESKPLSVGDIVSLQLENVAFASISACYSANNQNTDLMDEGLHMAGALQLAGYPQLVATLWSIDDESSKRVSELMYASLIDCGLEMLNVAEALNNAVRTLRDEMRSMDGILLDDDNPLVWAPYIYMGA
jgi:tetratricopeptide (TPR) repeat protein